MTYLYTMHSADSDKVDTVAAEMATLGAPSIRCVDCGDCLVAIEGVHRIAAAAKLGIAINPIILDQDDLVDADTLDWQDLQSGESYTAGELAGEAYSPQSGIYQLHSDNTIEAK